MQEDTQTGTPSSSLIQKVGLTAPLLRAGSVKHGKENQGPASSQSPPLALVSS